MKNDIPKTPNDSSFPGYTFSAPTIKGDTFSKKVSEKEFHNSLKRLQKFIAARSPDVILAKTAFQRRMGYVNTNGLGQNLIEQGQYEVLQALCLMQESQKNKVPTAPSNFAMLWPLVSANLTNFLSKQNAPDTAIGVTMRRIRTQTLYYRNIFDSDKCVDFVNLLLSKISPNANKDLGFSLLETWSDLVKLSHLIAKRQHEFASHIARLNQKKNLSELKKSIEYFRNANLMTQRAFQFIDQTNTDFEYLSYVGYQLSEIASTMMYTFTKDDLLANFSESSVSCFFDLSLSYGALKEVNPEHIYLDNPIWSKPFIQNQEGELFVPQIELIYSFPFKIIKTLIGENTRILTAYSNARATELEASIKDLVQSSMPSASVYQSVLWTDPASGKEYENDIVAFIGNHIIIFEAKSGQLRDSTRRGGSKSILDDFKELFIEPAKQANRLQEYLNEYGKKAVLKEKSGKSIFLNMSKPKVVVRYAVCIEHFASITSTDVTMESIGLDKRGYNWAPIISLGELQMMHRMLDSEVSFLHYLCRRFTLQDELTFLGDEQDLISAYVTNGFHFDKDDLDNTLVIFHEADKPARDRSKPRLNRRSSQLAGIRLSPLWQSMIDEIYQSEEESNKFDFIEVILNQHPSSLKAIERKIRLWKRGARYVQGDNQFCYNDIGNRRYALSVITVKSPITPNGWRQLGRELASEGMRLHIEEPKNVAAQCVSILILKKSKEKNYDAIQFNRILGFEDGKKPSEAPNVVP